ncbi:MAG TPA: hypothetical protein VGM91_23770 [Conexibacter sp.]|jgi:hypothetical protein
MTRVEDIVDQIAPISDAQVDQLSLPSELALRDAIMETPRKRLPRPPRHLIAPLVAGGAFAALAAIVVAVALSGGQHHSSNPPLARQPTTTTEPAPHYVLDAPGWRVITADQYTDSDGHLELDDGAQQLELSWAPARWYRSHLVDREHDAHRLAGADVAGHRAAVFDFGPEPHTPHDFTALWRDGRSYLELRTHEWSTAPFAQRRYRDVLAALRSVDRDAWLERMPRNLVLPDERPSTVKGLLGGTPLPQGFDRDSLMDRDAVNTAYEFGVEVANSVTCAWVGAWAAAKRGGDQAATQAAVTAMSTAPRWRSLALPYARQYRSTIVRFADAMARDKRIGGRSVTEAARNTVCR